MRGGGAVREKRSPVRPRAVSLMNVEAVCGMTLMKSAHQAVAADLRDYRSAGDGGKALVSAYVGAMRDILSEREPAV